MSLTHVTEKSKAWHRFWRGWIQHAHRLSLCPPAPPLCSLLSQAGSPSSWPSGSRQQKESFLPQGGNTSPPGAPRGGRPQREKHPQDLACQKDGMKV